MRPGGNPAASASSAKRNAENGASSMGLATTQLPAASAAPALRHIDEMPPFHVAITATTP